MAKDGLAAHSGVPQNGVNAIVAAGEAISALKRILRRLRIRDYSILSLPIHTLSLTSARPS
jgi:metal-dependent amidase/aminoacylase/carboxypeptidase family protein